MSGTVRRRRATVAVSLLGGVRIVGGSAELNVSALGRRAEIVVARLALDAGHGVTRAALAEAVWGEHLPSSWRPSLRNVVADLRRALAGADFADHVVVTGSESRYTLQLAPGATVDVVSLRTSAGAAEAALGSGEPARARELAERGLADTSQPALARSEGEWVEGLRDEVAELRARLEYVAGTAALQAGDAPSAERWARALIGSAPLREDGHRLLIRALRAAGRRAEALAAYDACRRRLDSELGALPAPATQELFVEILAEERDEYPRLPVEDRWVPVAAGLVAHAESTPFVGRAQILEWLHTRAGLVGEAGTFVITMWGEPGLGKTRLAAELAARCHRDRLGLLYGRAEARPGTPYAALVEALERGLAGAGRERVQRALEEHLDVLRALVPSLRIAGDGRVGEALQPGRVRRAIVAALGLLGGEGGGLLVLDDMQWASRAELEVIEELLSDPEAARLLVLVLHRRAGDAAELPALGEHPRVARRALAPFAVEDVRALARLSGDTIPGGDGEEDGANALWRASGGNPLLVSELLAAGADTDGTARPARLGELVGSRVGALPPGTEEVLGVAAVAGLTFDRELVAAVSGAGRTRAGELLEAARAAALLRAVEPPDGRLFFRHGLVRDVLLDGLGPGEQARLHERIGEALEGTRSGELEPVVLAHHFAAAGAAGEWRRALRYGLPVARHAFEVGVYEDVIAISSRTLDALAAAGDPDPRSRRELEVLVGGAQRALGDAAGAETLTAAFAAARAAGDGAGMADAGLAFSVVGAWSEGLFVDDGRLALYEQALAALDGSERGRRARLLARLASATAWRRSEPASRPLAEEAQALARELGDERTLAGVLATTRLALAGSADLQRRAALEEELGDLVARLDDAELGFSLALWRYAGAVQRGEGDGLEVRMREAAALERSLRVGNLRHSLAYEQASLALLRGRVAEAEVLVERAAEIGLAAGLEASVVQSIRLAQMILIRGEQRRLGELRDEVALIFEGAGIAVWDATVAAIDAARGDLDRVGERVDAMIDEYERTGPTVLLPGPAIPHLAVTVVRLGERERAERVLALSRAMADQGTYFAGFAGPVAYHLGLLQRFLGHEAEAAESFSAGAAFCARLGAPRWEARCRAAAVPGDGEPRAA